IWQGKSRSARRVACPGPQNCRIVRVALHSEADDEFAGAVRYYSQISPDLGVRFYQESNDYSARLRPIRSGSEHSTRPLDAISAAIFLTRSFFSSNQIASGSWR